jgi:hypothetical protein
MAASDSLGPMFKVPSSQNYSESGHIPEFYDSGIFHGSNQRFPIGHIILPYNVHQQNSRAMSVLGGASEGHPDDHNDTSWASELPGNAASYAQEAAAVLGGKAWLHRVEPVSPEDVRRGSDSDEVESPKGFRVTGSVPVPDNFMDWEHDKDAHPIIKAGWAINRRNDADVEAGVPDHWSTGSRK